MRRLQSSLIPKLASLLMQEVSPFILRFPFNVSLVDLFILTVYDQTRTTMSDCSLMWECSFDMRSDAAGETYLALPQTASSLRLALTSSLPRLSTSRHCSYRLAVFHFNPASNTSRQRSTTPSHVSGSVLRPFTCSKTISLTALLERKQTTDRVVDCEVKL